MNWIFEYGVLVFSVLCYMVILNGICGWIGFGIWRCIKKIWEDNGQYELLYDCLKFVILLFIIPIGWGIISARSKMLGSNITYNGYPWVNPKMAYILTGVSAFWLLGAAKNFREYILEKKYLRQLESMAHTLTGPEEKEMNSKGFSAVYICSNIYSPMVSGIFRKKLYLPEQEYTDYAKEVIVEHELMHLRHRDLFFKNLCAVITILYWFCPWVKIIFVEYDCWSEEMCDLSLCLGEGARWTAREYYSVILAEAEYSGARKMKRCSALFENKNTVEWRVKAMKHYHDVGKRKKWLSGVLAGAFILSSPLTAFASGNAVELGLGNIYDTTMVEVKEQSDMEAFNSSQEIIEKADINENTIKVSHSIARGAATYTWTIEKGGRYTVNNISLKSGDQVNMRVKITSGSGPVDMGVIKGSTKRYIAVMKDESHIFKIDKNGLHNFYVENKSSGAVTIEYTYSF